MRCSMSAQSMASTPPAPAWMASLTPRSSYGPERSLQRKVGGGFFLMYQTQETC